MQTPRPNQRAKFSFPQRPKRITASAHCTPSQILRPRDPDAPPLFRLPRQPPPRRLHQRPVPPLPFRVHPPRNPRRAQDPCRHVVPRRARGRRAQLPPRARPRRRRRRRQGRRRRRRRGTRGAEVVGPSVARGAAPADAWGGEGARSRAPSAWRCDWLFRVDVSTRRRRIYGS